jgi:APA family basic amino acid/polyamine antiporter
MPDVEYANILVPVFGTELDDDIVSTAGRLASAESDGAKGGTRLEVLYVLEVPLALPLEAELPPEREEEAQRAVERAREVGEEYENVAVVATVVRARDVGAGIVEAARRSEAEAIVVGGEPPTKVRGGATLGGIGAAKPPEIGAATEYVLKKAPCKVLLTAPPD